MVAVVYLLVIEAVNPLPGCQIEDGGWAKFLLDSAFLIKLGSYATCIPNLSAPVSVVVDSTGAAYVTGAKGDVVKIDATPALVYPPGPVPSLPQQGLRSVDAAGNIYATTSGLTTKTSPTGSLIYSVPIGGFVIGIDGHGGAYVIGGRSCWRSHGRATKSNRRSSVRDGYDSYSRRGRDSSS